MRRPEKSNKLYTELRDAILCRRFQPGSLLQRETELAENYNVSRDTLRSALARLEKESLVRRIRGKGTYVSSGRELPKITFLLPCPASLYRSMFLTDILGGLMEATHQMDCQVETLALSPTNNPDDIDWPKLMNLGEDSRVVVTGFWFDRIFQFLRNSGCRVVFIHDGTFQKYDQAEHISHWVNFEKDQFHTAHKMAEVLLNAGCTNPAVLSRYLGENLQPRIDGALSCFKERGFTTDERALKLPPLGAPLEKLKQAYRQSLEKLKFDGFVMDDPILFQYILTRNPTLKGGCFDYRQEATGVLPESAFYSEFPLKQIGFDAAAELLKSDFKPCSRKYKGKVYDHNGKEL